MKDIKEFMIDEASFDNYTNIINSVKEEFRALASHANDEYTYKTYDFIYEILKCFDVSETYLLKNLDKSIIDEIKQLRYKISKQYL